MIKKQLHEIARQIERARDSTQVHGVRVSLYRAGNAIGTALYALKRAEDREDALKRAHVASGDAAVQAVNDALRSVDTLNREGA